MSLTATTIAMCTNHSPTRPESNYREQEYVSTQQQQQRP